jgi:hypothetical protein
MSTLMVVVLCQVSLSARGDVRLSVRQFGRGQARSNTGMNALRIATTVGSSQARYRRPEVGRAVGKAGRAGSRCL